MSQDEETLGPYYDGWLVVQWQSGVYEVWTEGSSTVLHIDYMSLIPFGCPKPSENYSHVRNVVADIGSLGTVADDELSPPDSLSTRLNGQGKVRYKPPPKPSTDPCFQLAEHATAHR